MSYVDIEIAEECLKQGNLVNLDKVREIANQGNSKGFSTTDQLLAYVVIKLDGLIDEIADLTSVIQVNRD